MGWRRGRGWLRRGCLRWRNIAGGGELSVSWLRGVKGEGKICFLLIGLAVERNDCDGIALACQGLNDFVELVREELCALPDVDKVMAANFAFGCVFDVVASAAVDAANGCAVGFG